MVDREVPEPRDWKLKDLLSRYGMTRRSFQDLLNWSADPRIPVIREGIYRKWLLGPEIVPVAILPMVIGYMDIASTIPIGQENKFVAINDNPGCSHGLDIQLVDLVKSPVFQALRLTDPLIGNFYWAENCYGTKIGTIYATERAYEHLGMYFGFRFDSWISISLLARYFNVHKTTIWRSIRKMEKYGAGQRTRLNHLNTEKDGVPETYLNESLAETLERFRSDLDRGREFNVEAWETRSYEEIIR